MSKTSKSTDLVVSDWEKMWDEGHTGFHKSELHVMLVKHLDVMLRGRKNIQIFFPLCGKAVDMKWLYDEGHTIIGLEASAKGIQDFFNENNLKFTSESVADGKFTLYKTEDNRLQLYCGDIYDFNSSIVGKMQGIWDRGSLVAINREDRETYSKTLIDLMANDCHYLVETLQYDKSEYAGPPHSMFTEEVHKLYGEKCNVSHINEMDAMNDELRGWGLSKCQVTILELTLKQ